MDSTQGKLAGPGECVTPPMQHAENLVRGKGLAVLPLKVRGKAPLTPNGYKDASADLATVQGWADRFPGCNYGIRTGQHLGEGRGYLAVLDIDPRHGGDESLASWEAENAQLPETFRVKTGGGGEHLYFSTREPIAGRGNLFPGVDLKAEGGYVVGPGSIHASGNNYVPDPVPPPAIAPLPDALLALALAERTPRRAAISDTGPGPGLSEWSKEALYAISPDCDRDTWIAVGMALHYEDPDLSGEGFRLWDEWSATSREKYKPGETERQWASFKRGGGITEGRLWKIAGEHGWDPHANDDPELNIDLESLMLSVALRSPHSPNGKHRPQEDEALPVPVRLLDMPKAEPPQWQIRKLVTRGDIGLLVSDGGVGKSTMAYALAAACAGGYPAFDDSQYETGSPTPVLIVSEEDPAGIIQNRVEALIAGHGWDRERIVGNVHILAMGGVSLDERSWQEHIAAQVQTRGIGLVIFDPYAELTLARENDNDAAKPLIRFWRRLSHETGTTVLVVHHLGKLGEGKRAMDRIRGASALYSAARFAYALEPAGESITVECLKLSRAAKPEPFALHRTIESAPDNETEWQSATLAAGSALLAEANVRMEAKRRAAERFKPKIVEHLRKHADQKDRTKTEIQKKIKGDNTAIWDAFAALCSERIIRYIPPAGPGKRGECYLAEEVSGIDQTEDGSEVDEGPP